MTGTVTILGAGVMGSAMVLPLHDRGMAVHLVGTHLDDGIIASVGRNNFHPKLNVTLPQGITAFSHDELNKALGHDTDLIVLGVSSAGVDWATAKLASAMKRSVPVLMITKGMAVRGDSLLALPDVVQQALEARLDFRVPVAAIAGPCIAGELAVRRPTGTVIVSRDLALAADLCARLQTEYYHPRPSLDMMGAEICAAFKNFFAIAVGWAHGRMEVMDAVENKARNNNAAAILFDQAVREMIVLTRAFGGTAESVWGMPGVGDLYVTCQAGRNARLGNYLGRGMTYSDVKSGPMKDDTIEGAELGLAVAPAIHAMAASGRLTAVAIPLTLALLKTLSHDQALEPPWAVFSRSH